MNYVINTITVRDFDGVCFSAQYVVPETARFTDVVQAVIERSEFIGDAYIARLTVEPATRLNSSGVLELFGPDATDVV